MIPQDHSGICKYSTKLGAYITVSSALNQVFSEITGRLQPEQDGGHRVRSVDGPRTKDD